MNTTLEINLADILEQKYPHGFHAPADIDIGNFLEFADDHWMHQVEIDDLLAANRLIGVVWDVQLVLDERPDLTEDQAWTILQACRPYLEEVTDPMRATIRRRADDQFPKPNAKAALRAQLARIDREIEALPEDECTDPAAYGSVSARLDTVATLVKRNEP
jgi:hypothetical protein